MRADSREMHGP